MDYEKKYKDALIRARAMIKIAANKDEAIGFANTIFPELKENDEMIRKELINFIKKEASSATLNANRLKFKSMLAWLENQGEQKPADKVESKFKVGDWVTDGEYTWKVTNIKRLDYILQSQNGDIVDDTISYVDEHFYLWTIEDAKDGDILVFDDITMIFKNIKTACTANTYILYCVGEGIVVDDWCDFGNNAQPATKEQRELLFSKMKEAGYEWNTDEKALVMIGIDNDDEDERYEELMKDDEIDLKIKQKPAKRSDKEFDDFFNLESVIDIVEMYGKGEVRLYGDDVTSELEWLKSLRDRLQPQPKQEWSKEDDEMLNRVKQSLYHYQDHLIGSPLADDVEIEINWLKSLKPQSHWKPTDEQMSCFRQAIDLFKIKVNDDSILRNLNSLYKELKKL